MIITLLLVLSYTVSAQTRYRVYFKDKQTTFNAYTYFDAKAINRRINHNLSLADSTDFPVNSSYINTVTNLGDSIGIISRWFNFMAVYTDDARAEKIKQLPFVARVDRMEYPLLRGVPSAATAGCVISVSQKKSQCLSLPLPRGSTMAQSVMGRGYIYPSEENLFPLDSFIKPANAKLLHLQIDMMQGRQFITNGLNGKGIRIAIFDAGFPNVNTANVFEDIVKENRIISTYNFGRKNDFVYSYNAHGAMVMACIGGKIKGRNIGLATAAEFLLAITENPSFEAYKEEENWLAAAEWADKNGADIINSSLGYTDDLYFTEDMNGRASLIGRAATMAVKKGILVVSAAGNEGKGKWQIVASPGDVDSVLTVGAVDPFQGYHAEYSSYGPNRNMHIKPNVSAAGTVLSFDRNHLGVADGTSFASPLVAGFAACVLQQTPTLKNYELYKQIEQSGSLYPYYDYAHGYGVPQTTFFVGRKETVQPTFQVIPYNGNIVVRLDSIYFSAAREKSEKLVYYHVQKPNGVLAKYYVVLAEQRDVLSIDPADYEVGDIIRFHYRGYTYEYRIKGSED